MAKHFWNAARAAQQRRPHRRSVLEPVGEVPIAWPLDEYDRGCEVCGYLSCDGHETAPPAEQTRPVAEWTYYARCDAGWVECRHLAGSDCHVYPDVKPEYVAAVGAGYHTDYAGTLEDCKLWVEQYERDRAAKTAKQQEKLLPGWRATVVEHWLHGKVEMCTDPKPTREEAMAAALGYTTPPSSSPGRFTWGCDNAIDFKIAGPESSWPTAQAAALAALAYDARKRGLS